MNLGGMAPNSRRSALVTMAFSLLATGIYFLAVSPTKTRLEKSSKALSDHRARHATVMKNLASSGTVAKRIEETESALKPFRDAMLEPLLEALAMRAKSLVDAMAQEAGLADLEYEALGQRALPVPGRMPRQLHSREPIRITARGSYQAAASFLMRLERDMPLVALEALSITAVQATPETQRVEMILEWPVKGAVTRQ